MSKNPPTTEQAKAALQELLNGYHALKDADRFGMSEASVVRQFIDRLLDEVLGWDIRDPNRYKYELVTEVGRPDVTLIPERGGVIYLEAKRFGKIDDLVPGKTTIKTRTLSPAQMTLPGLATDRTREEQQAINYAFGNGGTWAILTNFEKMRVFNAKRDWLVLSFEQPFDYLHDFDLFWQLAYQNVINGSLDQLSNQRHAVDIDTRYLEFINMWRERLARDLIARRDQNGWIWGANGEIQLHLLRSVVQRFLDRLVVARFAEDQLVIPPGTLRSFYDMRRENRYSPPLDTTLDQFFRAFDREHNSALFAPGLVDEATFGDEALLELLDKLYEVRYRAMPADILGNTYEQYLGKALAVDGSSIATRDNLETRKKQGSYYTPQVIVRYIVDHSLGRYLYATADGKPDGKSLPEQTRKTARDIRGLRVLDSACGSGSFLIYAYQVLAEFYKGEIDRLLAEKSVLVGRIAAQEMSAISLDDRVEAERLDNELGRIQHNYPRLILETHLYGVDLDPQAAEIAVVNLMMRAMEQKSIEKRLPLILDQSVKVGNGLVGLRADDPRMDAHKSEIAKIRQLRIDLLNSDGDTDAEKTAHERIASQLEAATAALNAELNKDFAPHFSDLERVRPLHWGVEFPEVFYDENGDLLPEAGFAVVIGNPPWEIVKPDLREFYAQFDAQIESRLNRAQAETRIAELDVIDPRRRADYAAVTSAAEETASYSRASDDYTHQGRGDTATHKLFTERAWTLLQSGGYLGYVIPSGIYTDLGTKELREMLLNEGSIQNIFSFSNERFFFKGVDHRFKFALVGAQKGEQTDGFWAAFRFNPRVAVRPDDLPDFLANEDNLIYVRRESLKRFSPDSLSVMEFQTRRDYDVAEKIYGEHPLLGEQVSDKWNVRFAREFDMANDSHLFNETGEGLPLYEGKMIHQFDAFFGENRYWVNETRGGDAIANKECANWYKGYRFAFRAITNSTNERTGITTMLPKNNFTGHSIWVGIIPDHRTSLYFISLFNSFVLDWIIRFRVTSNLTLAIAYQLPVPRLTAGDPYFAPIVARAAKLTCTRPEFADLWESVMGSAWDQGQAAVDPHARQVLRDELDVLVARLYGLDRDEFAHILGTFPLVFPDTDAGRARRESLLGMFDRGVAG